MSTEISVLNKQISKKEKFFYYLSAVLLPNIFLFVLYNGNHDDSQIVFSHVLILALILAVIGAVGLMIAYLIVRNYEGSLLVLLVFWPLFWLFEAIYHLTSIGSKNVLLVLIIGIVLCITVVLRFISGVFYKGRIIFNMIAGVVCLLFTFNIVPAVLGNMGSTPEISVEQADFYIMRTFNVNPALPSPDIYWFHMDGMINFADMYYFFDEPLDGLRGQLLERGFVINEEAEFNTHDTIFGVPALLSPAFYDSYLGEVLAEKSQALRRERSRFLNEIFERSGISLADDIAPYHELFHALLQSSYRQVMIANFDHNVYVPLDYFYRLGSTSVVEATPLAMGNILEAEPHFLQDAIDLIELVTLTTFLPYRIVNWIRYGQFDWVSIPSHIEEINHWADDPMDLDHERQLYRRLIDSFSIEEPTILYMTLMFTHGNRWQWQDEELAGHGNHSYRIDIYPTAYHYAGSVMINMIDMILEQNPNAVIVLQSDHGFHLHATQRQLLENGLTEAEVAHLQNSVMSAVRIPEQYGGLVEPLDPRNITRELVNRFVGQNYQLLTE